MFPDQQCCLIYALYLQHNHLTRQTHPYVQLYGKHFQRFVIYSFLLFQHFLGDKFYQLVNNIVRSKYIFVENNKIEILFSNYIFGLTYFFSFVMTFFRGTFKWIVICNIINLSLFFWIISDLVIRKFTLTFYFLRKKLPTKYSFPYFLLIFAAVYISLTSSDGSVLSRLLLVCWTSARDVPDTYFSLNFICIYCISAWTL